MKIIAGLIVYATFAMLGATAALWVLNDESWRVAAAGVCMIIGAGWPLAVVMAGAKSEQKR